MNVYRNLCLAAAANVLRYRARSAVVVLCLVAICGPYVAGVAISEGLRADARLSVDQGADLYLTMDQFGRNGPVALKYLDAFRQSPYIVRVVPRIAGRAWAEIGFPDRQQARGELLVVLGLEPAQLDQAPRPAQGRLPNAGGEILIGNALARELQLAPGAEINLKVNDNTRAFRVVGVFGEDTTMWSAQLVCLRLDDAGDLFGLPGYASDFLIYTRPGPGNIQEVRRVALDILGRLPYRLQSKQGEVASYIDKGFRGQQGIFSALFLVAFAVGIPALLVASGLGLSDRRREIGLCKAVGWQTTDVMVMVVFEQVLLSVVAACLAVLGAFVWVRGFNGLLVAQLFISQLNNVVPFRVPARFTPAPALLALLLCLAITLVGSLFSTWRLATQPPSEVMR